MTALRSPTGHTGPARVRLVGTGELWVTHASSLLGEAIADGRGVPGITVPGGRHHGGTPFSVHTPRRVALPCHRPGAVRAVTSPASIRWPGPAGHVGCVTRPYHAGCVARQCREHTTTRGGSTHNSGRPRPRRPGTRHIRWPSPPVLAPALPCPRSARARRRKRR